MSSIQPYNFEPLVRDQPLSQPLLSESDSETEDRNEQQPINAERVGNINWCSCNNCEVMDTERESLCCREVPKVLEKLHCLPCVLLWPRFIKNCLDLDVLEPAYDRYVQETNDRNDYEIHMKYRYVAYRQFVSIIYRKLGRNRRVILPSCVISKIRDTFPSEEYAGFKYPRY